MFSWLPLAVKWPSMKSAPPPAPVSVAVAETWKPSPSGVTCSVTPEGDGFHVSATATLTGAGGGALFIDGHFTASGNQENISATFTSNERGSYVETDHKCTAIYSQP